MMAESEVLTLGALVERGDLVFNDGYRTKRAELGQDGFQILRVAQVKDGTLDPPSDPEFVRVEFAAKIGNKLAQPGDIILTTKGTVGRRARVPPGVQNLVYSPQLCFFRIKNHQIVDPDFLYSWLGSREFVEQTAGIKAQTDMADYISLRDLRQVRIALPPISRQRDIGRQLRMLDDKIELNRRMNETLEATARAIFKSWFVNFDPVRAKMEGRQPIGMSAETAALLPNEMDAGPIPLPVGWARDSLGSIVDVIDCLHSKKPDKREVGRPLLQLANIRDDGLLDMSDRYLISEDDYAEWTRRMEAEEGDCVITNVGRVGAVARVPKGIRAALGRNMSGLRLRHQFPFPTFLIECLLSYPLRSEIRARTDEGTVLSALNVKDIPRLVIVRPPQDVVRAFEEVAGPIRAMMETNLSETHTLGRARSALLPELLSGRLHHAAQ